MSKKKEIPEKRIVWGLSYKLNIRGQWSKNWNGPCGIYAFLYPGGTMGDAITAEMLENRPLFFSKRKFAEQMAKMDKSKSPENSVRWRIEKYELTWTKAENHR